MRSPRTTAIAGLLCLSVVLTACGTRRPDADFAAAAGAGPTQGAGGTGGTTGAAPGGAGGSTTGQPVGAGSTGTRGLPEQGAGGSGGGTTGGTTTGTTGGDRADYASDVGVTATTISLGNIVTRSGSFGPDQFTPFYYGAAAYFDDLDAHGGINGRRVVLSSCDDGGDGSQDAACARNLVDQQKVFAFVANNCLACDGLTYVSQKGVPSVGGIAVDFRDYGLPHFWRYSGDPYPQDGRIGYHGDLYQGTQPYRFFKLRYGVKKAAVVYYDTAAASKNQGDAIVQALQAEGIETVRYPENFALPNFDADVIDMKSKGITAVWDAIDISGNQNLCKAIDSNGLKLVAKVSTVAGWSQEVGTQFSYPCRSYIFAVEEPGSLGYDQTGNPQVAAFRAAMHRYFPDRDGKLYQWTLDGWASAMWFADAATSCGASLTRACLEHYLNRPQGYTARGLWWPRNNQKWDFATKKTLYRCVTVAQWDEGAKDFVTRGSYPNTCWTTPYLAYPAPP